MKVWIRRSFGSSALAALLAGCASDDAEPTISYDPSLKPGQIFFNPSAQWVGKWEKVPAPAVTKEKLEAKVDNTVIPGARREAEDIPWTIVKPGVGAVPLAVGEKPNDVLKADVIAKLETQPVTTVDIVAAEIESGPAPTAEDIAQRAPASVVLTPRSLKPIIASVDYPLANSLAVESERLKAYSVYTYNWDVPVAAAQPFVSNGSLMNGYFFVRRRRESWRNLSKMVYGTTRMHRRLRQWNNDKPLKVGTILYYNSPHRPHDDAQILTIADDFGQAFLNVRLKNGESLSTFGRRTYGEWRTWKEIAFFNHMHDPHNVSRKERLRIQPVLIGHGLPPRPEDLLKARQELRDPASQR